jgi:hypothetical protein
VRQTKKRLLEPQEVTHRRKQSAVQVEDLGWGVLVHECPDSSKGNDLDGSSGEIVGARSKGSEDADAQIGGRVL